MNQGKLEVVKQEMARVDINILGTSELKWIGMGEFNSDDRYIYYCFRKGRGTRDQIANIHWIIKKGKEFRKKTSISALLTKPNPLTVENSERDGNTRPPDLPLRNLYAGQEARVRTRHGTTDWFQIGKGVHQGCILSPCLFNF